MVTILFWMVAAHAVADYALQNDFVAKFKSHKVDFQGGIIWPWVLGAHALIHGACVSAVAWAFTGLPQTAIVVGVIEAASHFATDYAKCDGRITFNQDQVIHLTAKAAFACILTFGSFQ